NPEQRNERPSSDPGPPLSRGGRRGPVMNRDEHKTRLLLKQEIEEFLYYEADLLDERRYEDWLALVAEDVRYWMPMRRNIKVDDIEREFTREGLDISWFDEGKATLTPGGRTTSTA